MKKIGLLAFIICAGVHCNKNPDSLGGNGLLAGRLFYYNPYLSNTSPYPLGGRSVKIANHPSDTLNFIYSVETDSAGYFTFANLNTNASYDIFFDDSVNGNKAIAFLSAVKPGNDSIYLQVIPDTATQTVFHLTVADNNNGVISNASICIFNSLNLFQIDTCQGSVYQALSDVNGTATLFNVKAGTYYLRTQALIAGVLFYHQDTFTVKPFGVSNDTIRLSSSTNVVLLNVMDNTKGLISNAYVCIFNSGPLFLADTCQGSVYQVTTDANGNASLANIAPGTYYLRTQANVNGILYYAQDTLIVRQSGITVDTIKAGPALGLLNLVVMDTKSGLVNNTTVCVFSSPVIFSVPIDTCEGSVYQAISDDNGNANFGNLLPGTYYIRAHVEYNGILLFGQDTIKVAAGINRDTMRLQQFP